MGASYRRQIKLWSWLAGTTLALAISGCSKPGEMRAPVAKAPKTSAQNEQPAAAPAEPGGATESLDPARELGPAAHSPAEPSGTEPLAPTAEPPNGPRLPPRAPTKWPGAPTELPGAPTQPPREPQTSPAAFPDNKTTRQVPNTPAAGRDDEQMDDPPPTDAPVLMRVDDLPSETEPAGQDSVTDAADPDGPCETLTVFYATDRERLAEATTGHAWGGRLLPLLVGAGVTLMLAILGISGWQRRRIFVLCGISGVLTLVWGLYAGQQQLKVHRAAAQCGVRYGNERGSLELGTCSVSIPATHEVGEIERPSLLRLEVSEDVRKHVVLHETSCQSEDTFYQQLRDRVSASARPEVFVFVHGYNVTFESAARRTAQIAHDVEFAGAPIFFSWPSQGGLLKYTVDENNVEWAVPHLKQLLLDVTRRSGAESVNLIAHSMGNRALTFALRELERELGEERALFNQIILAAPDIDAEIFRRDLAPALTRSSKHVTLYASSNDEALYASKQVHGHARAGDSGSELVVLPGIETVDVSQLDTSLLGHSYYGTSDPILADIRQLIEFALPAAQRQWLLPKLHDEMTYWVFELARTSTVGNGDSL